jgi:adenosylcobinamide-GDP ribazoletransferase
MSFADCRRALSLFSVLPVRADPLVSRAEAARALGWLPVIGLLVGALAGLPVALIRQTAEQAPLAGAVIGIAALAALTRGLHLDGLADTADGLASRAPAPQALDIMRKSDVGPFGVVALVLVLLVDVAAVAELPSGVWTPVAALATAAATGRVAVLHAALRRVPSARSSGFGALVTGSVSGAAAIAQSGAVLAVGVVLAVAVDANPVGWIAAQSVALALAFGLRLHTTARFGGVTGDVFGALVECATAVTLVGIALS